MNSRQHFITEYNELRDRGDTHNEIAQYFGIKRDSLMRKLWRANIYRPEPHEKPTYQKLHQLIDQQATFTAHDLPSADRETTAAAIKRARQRNLLRIIGTKKNTHGNVRYIYTANLQATA